MMNKLEKIVLASAVAGIATGIALIAPTYYEWTNASTGATITLQEFVDVQAQFFVPYFLGAIPLLGYGTIRAWRDLKDYLIEHKLI